MAKKLDNMIIKANTWGMGESAPSRAHHVTASVRRRIEKGGERVWQLEDFRDLPFTAVAQALSRLKREGIVERLSKGIYYRTRTTALGKTRPNPKTLEKLAPQHRSSFPAGVAAANLLGFSTQSARRGEIATVSASLPRKLFGSETIIHTRRPQTWASLSTEDAALLDFLRRAGRTSETSHEETIKRTAKLLSQENRYDRLLRVAGAEPPRVRAILGAFGENLGKNETTLQRLRNSLNPFSRFEFGSFSSLPNARRWQAKEAKRHEAV